MCGFVLIFLQKMVQLDMVIVVLFVFIIRMFLKNQSFATHSVNQIDKQAKMILSSNAANFVTNICFHSLLRLIEVL